MSNHEFLIEDETIDSSAEKHGDGFRVTVGDATFDVLPQGNGLFSTVIDGQKKIVAAVTHQGTTYVDIDSVLIELTEPSEEGFSGGGGETGEKDKVFAPMPGKIVKIMVEVGDTVEKKQQVVIVEAMKMENPVLAKAAGTVKAVNFAAGDQVDTDTPIVELDLGE